MTLEEVALEAVAENERLVARTSAGLLADRLGVDPGTAAGTLRDLRRRGLLSFERESGPAGRFGLSVYVLGDISGLRVLSPCPEWPCVAAPVRERPLTEISNLAPACTHEPSMEGPSAAAPLSRRPVNGSRCPVPLPVLSAAPRATGARLEVGVVVTAPVVASPKGWQVSAGGWPGGGEG